MEELFKKESKKIHRPIIQFVKSKLLSDFKYKQEHSITKVDGVSFKSLKVDVEKSEFKERIIITEAIFQAKVLISLNFGTSTKEVINLGINKRFVVNYDCKAKEYNLESMDGVVLSEKTMY